MKLSANRRGHGSKTLIFGITLSSALFLTMAFVAALISSKLEDPSSSVGIASLAAFLLSGAISGFITARMRTDGSIRLPMLSAILFLLILFSVGMGIKRGALPSIIMINLGCYALIFWLFALLGRRKRRRRR